MRMGVLYYGNYQMTIEEKYEIALAYLADWVVLVDRNGTGWDDWDEAYKDAAYRPCAIREDLDKAIAEREKFQ